MLTLSEQRAGRAAPASVASARCPPPTARCFPTPHAGWRPPSSCSRPRSSRYWACDTRARARRGGGAATSTVRAARCPPTVAAGALALLCLVARKPRAALLAVAGPGLTGLVTTFGKPVVDRTIGREESLAFPSGHTGGATSLALVCALLLAAALELRAGETLLLAAASAVVAGGAVGTGMVVAGAHYPTDVVGGFCTALAGATASSGVWYGMCACTRSCTNRSFPSTFGASTNG